MEKVITGAVIQVRMGSTRLPGKAVRLLHRQPLITQVIERIKTCKTLDKVILATTYSDLDEVLIPLAFDEGCLVFRGDEDDVLNRFAQAASIHHLTNVVRVTGDNPLISPRHLDLMVEQFLAEELDYSWVEGLPIGLGSEVVKTSVLKNIQEQPLEPYHKEHVTLYIRENLKQFKAKPLSVEAAYRRPYRLTVDTMEDFLLLEHLYTKLYRPGKIIDIAEALAYLDAHPLIAKSNAHVIQKTK